MSLYWWQAKTSTKQPKSPIKAIGFPGTVPSFLPENIQQESAYIRVIRGKILVAAFYVPHGTNRVSFEQKQGSHLEIASQSSFPIAW